MNASSRAGPGHDIPRDERVVAYGHGRLPPPTPPPGDFKSPGPQLSGSRGRLWWGSKRPFGLCGLRGNGAEHSALRRTPSSALGTVLAGIKPATPAVWSALLPPSATSPGRRVALSSTLPKALYAGLYVVQALFLPGLQGLGRRRRGGRETRPRPAVSRTWISPGRPYPLGSGRRSLAYPSGRPANSQFGWQNGNALVNWSAGARRRSQGTMTPAPWYCN